MEEVIAWIISGILTFVIGCICGRSSHRRTSTGTGSDAGRIGDSLEGTADDNQRLRDNVRTAEDQNQRAQGLVGRAKQILSEAKHTDGDN